MKRQCLKMSDNGQHYTIIRDYDQEFEYALYYHYRDIGKNGYPVNHRKLIDRYVTMYDALSALKEEIFRREMVI